MIVRACCNNCGFTGDHDVPYRAEVTSAFIEDRKCEGESSFKTDDGQERPFLCTNCGRATLEVIYWDARRKKQPIGIEMMRVTEG